MGFKKMWVRHCGAIDILWIAKNQTTQAMNALAEFVRLGVKEYPLMFADESDTMKIKPSKQYFSYAFQTTDTFRSRKEPG